MSYELTISAKEAQTLYHVNSNFRIVSNTKIDVTEIEKIQDLIKAIEKVKKARANLDARKPKFNVTARSRVESTSLENDFFQRAQLILRNAQHELISVKERYGVVAIHVSSK